MSSFDPRADGLQRQERRRAQNRAAQRAYRERKEQLRSELETQVKEWQDKHQALHKFYADQAQELQQLKKTIDNLQIQLVAIHDVQSTMNPSLFDLDASPDLNWKAA